MVTDPKRAAFQYYLSRGYPPHQAAAIVGSLQQESQFNPRAVGDQGTAFGIGQWRHDRFDNLKQFAQKRGKPWDDFGTQLAYLDWEMRNTEKKAGNKMRLSDNIKEALSAAYDFWRPAASREVETQKRYRYAAPLLGQMGAQSALPSPEDPVSRPPRRPHSQTPGMAAPQYEPDSPYYRAPAPSQTPAIPMPQAKPARDFDWQNAIGSAGNLLSALGGQQNKQQDAQEAARRIESQRLLDEAERRRRAWDQRFTWL